MCKRGSEWHGVRKEGGGGVGDGGEKGAGSDVWEVSGRRGRGRGK